MSIKELFLGYVKAYNAREVETMLGFFDDACVFENISAGTIQLKCHFE